MTPRHELKAATDDLHEQLDGLLSRLDLSDADQYRRFLLIQAKTVPALERALDAFGIDEHVDDWRQNRRSALLERDLAALGEPMPDGIEPPRVSSLPQAIGIAYVLEGSRLGGRILARCVGPEMPNSFLYPDTQKSAWPALVKTIDSALHGDAMGEAQRAARDCFSTFLDVIYEAETR